MNPVEVRMDNFDAVLEQYKGMIHLMCLKMARNSGNTHHFDDILQEGCLALIHAIQKYDHTRGYQFSTYLYYAVRNRVTKYFREVSRAKAAPLVVGGYFDPPVSGDNEYSPFDDLSEDALAVLHLLGDMPREVRSAIYGEDGRVKYGKHFLQGVLSDYLQGIGWTAKQTANAFFEISRMLANPPY